MEQIKRFFECLLPVTVCNLKCSYCYVIQRDNRLMKAPKLKYSPEVIGKGLSKERLGGTCYFSICGAGETLADEVALDISREILKQGHYINLTTNGTLSQRFDKMLLWPQEYVNRTQVAFSLHYLELQRVKKLDAFFDNFIKMRNRGFSTLLQINLCDEYVPYWDDIKELCIERVGAAPQVAATRREEELSKKVELLTDLSKEEYVAIGNQYESPLFDFTMQNFMRKQNKFCYAGDWTGALNLGTGVLSRCYASNIRQDIFKDISKPIDFQAIGCHCDALFCMNSSHFLSLGAIPDLDTPTYLDLRDRPEANWYSDSMKLVLSKKLSDANEQYGALEKLRTEIYYFKECILKMYYGLRKAIKKVIKRK